MVNLFKDKKGTNFLDEGHGGYFVNQKARKSTAPPLKLFRKNSAILSVCPSYILINNP